MQGLYEIESVGFKKLSKIRQLRYGEKDELRVVFALGDFVPVLDRMVPAENKLHNHSVMSLSEAKNSLSQIIR